MRTLSIACVMFVAGTGSLVIAGGDPTELLPGEAPVLFTGAEGEDADATLLADGVSAIRGDEIWLWVPNLDGKGNVDLSVPGQFFRIWDSGPEAGPDGNDDDDNGMRGMSFDSLTGTFLISYEDSTTTGFAFGNILDGDLMRMTPTAVTDGFVTGFTFDRLYNECDNGTAGCIGTGDINAIHLAPDGTLYFGSGTTQIIQTDVPGTLSATAGSLLHTDGITGDSPVNLGADRFFETTVNGCPVIFCPAIYTGQLRGADVLADSTVTFGTSGDYRNGVFSGSIEELTDEEAEALAIGVEVVCQKGDICSVPDLHTISMNTYQRRTGVVLYDGSLFYQTPHVGDAEILDHDILDTQAALAALIDLVGSDSDAGVALGAHLEAVDCPYDCADGDGTVGVTDLLAVLKQWGTPGSCDVDGGNVGVTDLLGLLSVWGDCE